MEKDLMEKLIALHATHPNDFEFGGAVRQLVWEHIENNSPAY
jgi:hypothetical protein